METQFGASGRKRGAISTFKWIQFHVYWWSYQENSIKTKLKPKHWWCHVFSSSGCPDQESSPECTNPFRVFQGCIRLLTLDNQPVDLIKVQQRLLGNYSHLQIDMCGIIDRLVSKNTIWIIFFPPVQPPQVSECAFSGSPVHFYVALFYSC